MIIIFHGREPLSSVQIYIDGDVTALGFPSQSSLSFVSGGTTEATIGWSGFRKLGFIFKLQCEVLFLVPGGTLEESLDAPNQGLDTYRQYYTNNTEATVLPSTFARPQTDAPVTPLAVPSHPCSSRDPVSKQSLGSHIHAHTHIHIHPSEERI